MGHKDATGKGARHRPKILGPQTPADKKFCERWLIHHDKDRAYREAGYTSKSAHAGHAASAKLEKFADYLRPFREAKAKVMAERLALTSEQIVDGMAGKVFIDLSTFYERSAEPLTEWVEGPKKGQKIEQVRTWHGKPIYGERLKPYSELTREQQAAVEITDTRGGVIHYRLPTLREQHMYLTSLGRQLGMFAEKLIIERHNHSHVTATLNFNGVPTPKILELQKALLPMVGVEFAQQLGFSPADVEAAAEEQGVLMPAR